MQKIIQEILIPFCHKNNCHRFFPTFITIFIIKAFVRYTWVYVEGKILKEKFVNSIWKFSKRIYKHSLYISSNKKIVFFTHTDLHTCRIYTRHYWFDITAFLKQILKNLKFVSQCNLIEIITFYTLNK